MRRREVLALLGIGGVMLAGCSLRHSYRYKMTVDVSTPQGVRSGFAVREVNFYSRLNGGDGAKVRGEAVAVDLPNGQVLFALLAGANGDVDYAAWIADWALKRELAPGGANPGYDAGNFAELFPTSPRTESPILSNAMPLLVHFKDIHDPTSVEKVDPFDLGGSFGAQYSLKRITMEITSSMVSVGIKNSLPWLGRYPEPILKNNHDQRDFSLAAILRHGDFRQGNYE